MLEDIQRLPRSISESTDWTPDWRDRQAMAYLAGYRDRFELRAGEGEREAFERALGAGMIRFPVREDDPVVKARFRHLAGAAVPGSEWTATFTNWTVTPWGPTNRPEHTAALRPMAQPGNIASLISFRGYAWATSQEKTMNAFVWTTTAVLSLLLAAPPTIPALSNMTTVPDAMPNRPLR